jgi:pilus assembly protein CpaB
MVVPADAERIALAATDGQIILALRNPLDKAATTTAGVRRWELTGGSEPVPAAAPRPVIVRPAAPIVAQAAPLPPAPAPQVAAAVAPAPVPSVYTVETIKAGKRDKEMVR